ncbi:MAG: hypothetical protein IBX55_16525, partial [Methyloprofundus sp.]|nr:hypothetical protein [Methyloprofundus sp.]
MTTENIKPYPLKNASNFDDISVWIKPLQLYGLKFVHFATGLLVPLMILGVWQLSFEKNWLPVQILPPPLLVWKTFWELLDSGDLGANLSISMQRIVWSVLIGGGIGLLIGFAVGLSKRAYAYIYPT